MKNLDIYTWWSYGAGDGDGNEDTIQVDDDTYRIIAELELGDEELDEIEDPRISKKMQEIYEEQIQNVKDDSSGYVDEQYREACLIDPEDPDYDPDGDEEQFTETVDEYLDDVCSWGCRLNHEFDPDETFEMQFPVTICLGGGDGGDVLVNLPVTLEEIVAIREACQNGEDLNDSEDLEDLVERISAEASGEAEGLSEDELENATYIIGIPEVIETEEEILNNDED